MLQIELNLNGVIEKKAKVIAKTQKLNNIDMEAIYKQLFDLQCDSNNLKGLWTLIFYHYGKYTEGNIT